MANLRNIQPKSDVSKTGAPVSDDSSVTPKYSTALPGSISSEGAVHAEEIKAPPPYNRLHGVKIAEMAREEGVPPRTLTAQMVHLGYLSLTPYKGRNRHLVSEQARLAGYGHNVDCFKLEARGHGYNIDSCFASIVDEKVPEIIQALGFDVIRAEMAALPHKRARLQWMLDHHSHLTGPGIAHFAGCTLVAVRKANAARKARGASENIPFGYGPEAACEAGPEEHFIPLGYGSEPEPSSPENGGFPPFSIDEPSQIIPFCTERTELSESPLPSLSFIDQNWRGESAPAFPQARAHDLSVYKPAERTADTPSACRMQKVYAEGDVFRVADGFAGPAVQSPLPMSEAGYVEKGEAPSAGQPSFDDLLDELLFPDQIVGGEHAPAAVHTVSESDGCEEGVLNIETDFGEAIEQERLFSMTAEEGLAESVVHGVAEDCSGLAVQSPSPQGSAEGDKLSYDPALHYAPVKPTHAFSGMEDMRGMCAPESDEPDPECERSVASQQLRLQRIQGLDIAPAQLEPRFVIRGSNMRERYISRQGLA